VETYASIFACWFAGHPYVPLNPANPAGWNRDIIHKLDIRILIDQNQAYQEPESGRLQVVCYGSLPETSVLPPTEAGPGDLVYILTTSGTTGEPRHVPVSLRNLEAFLNGFMQLFPEINETDRFLQTYDLTADASVTAFLVPLYKGGAVVLTPGHLFRYLAVATSLLNREITWVQVTPSLLTCLRPYFNSLNLPQIRYFHFGGEALPENLVNEFRTSVPNAEIANVYGPTETTVTTMVYKCLPGNMADSYKGTVSIGKPVGDTIVQLLSEDGSLVEGSGEGELLIGGPQLMKGYFLSESNDVFIEMADKQGFTKYYRTGDHIFRDESGNYHFLGRLNNQLKINGYRVDLKEVETAMSGLFGHQGVVAVAPEVASGVRHLVVFTTGRVWNEAEMKKKISRSYPEYLVPSRIIRIKHLPLGLSGKTDRKKLEQIYFSGLEHE
jgi:acyl-coenzyme A synthetase/AMP-(fatty) acid ligase